MRRALLTTYVGAVGHNVDVKVFISSVIAGFEPEREAAAAAIAGLGFEVVRAEDFPASPESPQSACLAGARQADIVVLVMGARYGFLQARGLSATHEEYREVRGDRPVLAFISNGVDFEPQQRAFVDEVQGWEAGHYTANFDGPEDLRQKMTRALHDYTLTRESAPVNEMELLERARELLPNGRNASQSVLAVVVSPGPTRSVLRPSELEAEQLSRALLAEALTGDLGVLTTAVGTQTSIQGDRLQLVQPDANRLVAVDESGRILVIRPAVDTDRGRSGIASIIEEEITAHVERALRFAGRVLDMVDPVNRLTHVVPVVSLTGSGYMAWRTRAEAQAHPNSASMNMGASEASAVSLSPAIRRRPALAHEPHDLAQDLTVRLRREAQG